MPLPTFLIAGAQKCGTSTLAATLRKHSEVHMARPKELHFFDRDHEEGLDAYAERFHPRPHHRAIGEATPVYLYDTESRERMCRALPEARIVVILRDPVKRAYSHFWHSKRLEFEDSETFEEALALEEGRLRSSRKERIRFSYVDRGHYLEQLDALAALHPAELVHVMLLDDLKTRREEALAELFTFLGVDPAPAHEIEEQWTNRYRVSTTPGEKAQVVAYPPMADETRERLVAHFAPHNEALAQRLGRDLSGWTGR